MFKKVQVAKYTNCRGYHISFANKQLYREKIDIAVYSCVGNTHFKQNTNNKFCGLVYEYYQHI